MKIGAYTHFFFIVNCLSAVALIFLNKFLLDVCAFHYIGLLAALHMGVTAFTSLYFSSTSPRESPEYVKPPITFREKCFLLILTDISMISTNLSLKLNSVGTYQLFKLLMIPTCSIMDFVIQGSMPSLRMLLAMGLVMLGVGVATITDISTSISGSLAAFASVLSSSGHNVGCSWLSRKYNINTLDFLRQTAPLQFASLLIIGPVYDAYTLPVWTWFDFSSCYNALAASCVLAAIVNISLVACIKQYDATGSQVLGHVKTVSILIIGWTVNHVYLGTHLYRQYIGSIIILVGAAAYAMDKPDQVRH